MPYNYKIHTAQQSQQEEAQDSLKEMGGDMAKELGGAIGTDLAVTGAATAIAPVAMSQLGNPSVLGGLLGYGGTKATFALVEEMQGAKNIFNNYYLDYNRLLDALSKIFPQNQELQQVINLGKEYGQKAHTAMNQANIQDPNVIQALGTGVDTAGKAVGSIGNLVSTAIRPQPQPAASAASTASFNYKNYRLAIVGNYLENATGYLNNAAAAGVGAGIAFKSPLAAGLGAGASLLWDVGKDVFHNMQSKQYQAAAYTKELKVKGMSMVAQLKKFNPDMANSMYQIINQIDKYVLSKIYGDKKAKVSQEFMSMVTKPQQQQGQQGQQQQQGQQGANPTQDVEFQNGIQAASQAYDYAQSLVGQPGMEKQYELYKNEYNVILQQLNQYLATNYPNVNADETIAIMMGAR